MMPRTCDEFFRRLRFVALFPLLLLLSACFFSDEPVILEKEKTGLMQIFEEEVPDISGEYRVIGFDGKAQENKVFIRDEKSANAFFLGKPDEMNKLATDKASGEGPSRILVEKLDQNHLLMQQLMEGNNETSYALIPTEQTPEGLRFYIIGDPNSREKTWNTELWATLLTKYGLTTEETDVRKLVRGDLSEDDYLTKVKGAVREMFEAKALGDEFFEYLPLSKTNLDAVRTPAEDAAPASGTAPDIAKKDPAPSQITQPTPAATAPEASSQEIATPEKSEPESVTVPEASAPETATPPDRVAPPASTGQENLTPPALPAQDKPESVTRKEYPPLVPGADNKPIIAAHLAGFENNIADVDLQILAPGKTLVALRVDNVGGVSSKWRSDGQEEAAPITVTDMAKVTSEDEIPAEAVLTKGDSEMALVFDTGEKLLRFAFTDNGAIGGGETDLRVTAFFSDKTRAMCLLNKQQ